MGSIMIQCPRTLRDVPVGIDTDKHSFEAMPAVHSTMLCPACGAKHVWSKNWAWLDPMTVVDEEVIEAQLRSTTTHRAAGAAPPQERLS